MKPQWCEKDTCHVLVLLRGIADFMCPFKLDYLFIIKRRKCLSGHQPTIRFHFGVEQPHVYVHAHQRKRDAPLQIRSYANLIPFWHANPPRISMKSIHTLRIYGHVYLFRYQIKKKALLCEVKQNTKTCKTKNTPI